VTHNYPKPPGFHHFASPFIIILTDGDSGRLIIASPSHGWQCNPETGVARSRDPIKFTRAQSGTAEATVVKFCLQVGYTKC